MNYQEIGDKVRHLYNQQYFRKYKKCDKLKLGIVVSLNLSFEHGTRGAEEHTLYNIGRMLSDEFNVELIGGYYLSPRLKATFHNYNYFHVPPARTSIGNLFLLLFRFLNALIYAWKHRPDVLFHIGGIGTTGLIVATVGRLIGIPSVVRNTGDTFNVYKYQDSRLQSFEFYIKNSLLAKISFILADEIITLGPGIKSKLIENGIDCNKIHIIVGPLDYEQFFPPSDKHIYKERIGVPLDKRMVLWVGRLLREKGIELLLEVIPKVLTQRKDILFYIIGKDLTTQKVYEHKLHALGTENVLHKEVVPHEEIGDYFRAADIFIFPTLVGGGYGNAALEALACGVPVIANDAGLEVSATYANLCKTVDDYVEYIVKENYVSIPLPSKFQWDTLKQRYQSFFLETVKQQHVTQE